MDGLLGVDLSFADDFAEGFDEDEGFLESEESLNWSEEDWSEDDLANDFDLEDDSVVEDTEDSVELESIDFREEVNQKAWEGVEFPALFIDGLTTEEEFSFFRGKNSEDKDSLPLYCVIEGTPVKVCQLAVCVQTFLNFKIIGGYTIRMCADAEHSTVIPLEKPETLMKFIKL